MYSRRRMKKRLLEPLHRRRRPRKARTMAYRVYEVRPHRGPRHSSRTVALIFGVGTVGLPEYILADYDRAWGSRLTRTCDILEKSNLSAMKICRASDVIIR